MNAPSSQPMRNAIELSSPLSFEDILFQLQYFVSKKSSNGSLTISDLLQEYDDVLNSETIINGGTPQEILDDKENELAPLRAQLAKYHADLQKRGLLATAPTKQEALQSLCPKTTPANTAAISLTPTTLAESEKTGVRKLVKAVRTQVALFLY